MNILYYVYIYIRMKQRIRKWEKRRREKKIKYRYHTWQDRTPFRTRCIFPYYTPTRLHLHVVGTSPPYLSYCIFVTLLPASFFFFFSSQAHFSHSFSSSSLHLFFSSFLFIFIFNLVSIYFCVCLFNYSTIYQFLSSSHSI